MDLRPREESGRSNITNVHVKQTLVPSLGYFVDRESHLDLKLRPYVSSGGAWFPRPSYTRPGTVTALNRGYFTL